MGEVPKITSDAILKGPIFLLPATSLISDRANDEFGNFAVMYLETNLITFGITELTKVIVKRTRPYAYNKRLCDDLKMELDTRKSFFFRTYFNYCSKFFFYRKDFI